jgi:hypothetical protein
MYDEDDYLFYDLGCEVLKDNPMIISDITTIKIQIMADSF